MKIGSSIANRDFVQLISSDTGFMVMSFQKVKNIGGWVPNAMIMLELKYS